MKTIIKDTLILLIITIVSGTALGFVYNITSKPRAEQEAKAKNEACKNVFPMAEEFGNPIDFDAEKVTSYIHERDAATKQADPDNSNGTINASIDEIVEAKDKDGTLLGYVITVTDNEAYDGKIKFSVGISMDKEVYGISFLSISETPGLGMRASEDDFISQFKNIKTDYFKYTKNGASSTGEIDALSGATITTNAVTNGATAAVYCFDYITGGGDNGK